MFYGFRGIHKLTETLAYSFVVINLCDILFVTVLYIGAAGIHHMQFETRQHFAVSVDTRVIAELCARVSFSHLRRIPKFWIPKAAEHHFDGAAISL